MPPPIRLVLASGNPHKLSEFQALAAAADAPFEVLLPASFGGMPAVSEDTGTFAGNARKKARALRRLLPPGAWALADDSGLCVDILNGSPGVESAHFAGPQGDPAANLAKLVRLLCDVPERDRGAHFTCVLALAGADGTERLFEGRCDGRLAVAPRGMAGFGYDPLFLPAGYEVTFAEISAAEKNRISHRARAWRRLRSWFAESGREEADEEAGEE